MSFKIGCDPEIFVFDVKQRQFVFPTFVPGTKEEPYKVDGGAIQRDGFAAEINIDPADNVTEFVSRTKGVIKQLGKFLTEDHRLINSPIATISTSMYDKIKKEQPKLLELGCDPDYQVYRMGTANPRPNDSLDYITNPVTHKNGRVIGRSGAGHVHIGWTANAPAYDKQGSPHFMDAMVVVNQLDVFLAPFSVAATNLRFGTHHGSLFEQNRRARYGRAGAFRPKHYGVEYRTPSNGWLSSELTMANTYHLTYLAMMALDKGLVASTPEFATLYSTAWGRHKSGYRFEAYSTSENTSREPNAMIYDYAGVCTTAWFPVLRDVITSFGDKELIKYFNDNIVPLSTKSGVSLTERRRIFGDFAMDEKKIRDQIAEDNRKFLDEINGGSSTTSGTMSSVNKTFVKFKA